MTIWIDPNKELPPQGKNILWFDRGDMQLVQRLGKYWFPIPFTQHEFAQINEPELWANIDAPEGFTGKLHVYVKEENRPIDIDELEMMHPDIYNDFINAYFDIWKEFQDGLEKEKNGLV